MKFFRKLWRDASGVTAVEFSLLGPVMITAMLGVLQIGTAMWSYNSMRSVAHDAARFAVVNYQTGNRLTESQVADYVRSVATNSPYGLDNNNLTITVAAAGTQRVTGATELTMTISYAVPTVLSLIGLNDIPMSYSRPVFLTNAS